MDASGWRWTGYELMERIEPWAKAWPEGAVSAQCDDSVAASSVVWLVSLRRRFGQNAEIAVVSVPQCTGEAPATVILSPEARDGLIEALRRTSERRAE